MRTPSFVLATPLLLVLLSAALRPQGKNDDEIQKLGPVDPYTAADPEAMERAGVVAYAPMAWADHQTTADVERVLGEQRVLWLETAHFRIGSTLRSCAVPGKQEQKKFLLDEIERLNELLPKTPKKPRKLDPWLRVHLYAQRAEAAYAAFQQRMGIRDEDFPGGEVGRGRFFGMGDKYLLLLFHQQSDVARYLDRFHAVKADKSYRVYCLKSSQMLAAVSSQGIAAPDDLALYSHVAYCLTHNFVSGYRGFFYELPAWFGEGLAQHEARRVPTTFANVLIAEDDVVDEARQHLWPQKVRARVGFDSFPKADALLAWKVADLDYIGHVMCWSRVDWLLTLGDERLALFCKEMKSMPLPRDGTLVPHDQLVARQRELLQQIYGFDLEGFDAAWKEWVLKTYPRK